MAITDIADVKTYLGLDEPTAVETALLTLLLAKAEVLVKEYVGYWVEGGVSGVSYTEYLPNRAMFNQSEDNELIGSAPTQDLSRLFLPELPIRSISSIYANESAYGISANWTSDYLLTAGTHYFLDVEGSGLSKTGVVYRIGANWPSTPRSIRVVYLAGYTEAELAKTNFPDAVIKATAAGWNQCLGLQGSGVGEGFGPMTREQIGTWEGYYDAESVRNIAGLFNDLPVGIKTMLHRYRRIDL